MAGAIGFLLEILHKNRQIELTNATKTGIMIVHNAHRRSIAIFTVSEVSIPPRRTESKRKYEHFNNATWRIIIYMEPNKKGCDESIWQ